MKRYINHTKHQGDAFSISISARRIYTSPSTTQRAKQIAAEIETLSSELYREVRHNYVEEDGTVTYWKLKNELII